MPGSPNQRSRIGPFALEAPLGGANSNVLRGLHLDLKRSMAVKLVDPGVLKNTLGRGGSFMDDVHRLQELQHPGLARVWGGAVEQGQPYLALELVEGESLAERLDRRGRLAWEPAVELGEAICLVLKYLHQKEIVHRRLTPAHIMLPDHAAPAEPSGALIEEALPLVKLIGLDNTWTDRDEVLGLKSPMDTAHYLSPEQFRGRKSCQLPACDLFSLGVIMYRSLTGEFPWPAANVPELIAARRATPAPRVSTKALDAPVWLDAVVAKLLAVKRAERYATADNAHRAIVNARRKVTAGVGAAAHGFSGKQGSLSVDPISAGADPGEIKRLRRKRTKKRDDSPFYEKAWFLALCLAGLIGAGVWAMLPASEAALFAKAQPLMASEEPADWEAAESRYLNELNERFPDSQYAEQLAEFEERLAMFRALRKVKNPGLSRRAKKSEAHRRFADAMHYEDFGDRLTAWKKYEAVSKLFGQSEEIEDRAFALLATERAKAIASGSQGQGDLAELVQEKLNEAKQLAESGNLLQARRLLSGIETLYGANRELKPLVEQAALQLRLLDEPP